MMPDRIVATKPWLKHKFPAKSITRRVVAARRPYRCETMGTPPADHVARIRAGEVYLKVNLRPSRGSSSGWRTRRFCRACAVHFELAIEAPE